MIDRDELFSAADGIVDSALDLSGEERAAYVAKACEGNPPLRKLVDRLLADCEGESLLQPGGAMRGPLWDGLVNELAAADSKRRQELRDQGEDGPRVLRAVEDAVNETLAQLSATRVSNKRYSVRDEIGRGGGGAVHRAWDLHLGRELAMKVIHSSEATGAPAPPLDTVWRFLSEAKITGRLDHPGVVPVYDLGVDEGGRVYFTMSLVRGRDLRHIFDLVREGREGWNVPRALAVLLKACETVAYAHSKGVIHRDLKPANIMVGKFGEVHVMDWGLAKIHGDQDADLLVEASRAHGVSPDREEQRVGLTMDGTVMGTPVYMPPEQAHGKVQELGRRSDVYSFGAMLYELLTGHGPYTVRNAHAGIGEVTALSILSALREGPPAPISDLAPRLPAELVAICEKAMAREPEHRYSDTMELANDLRAYLEDRVVSAHETGALAEFRKWVVRNKGIAAAIFVAILTALGGLAGATYFQVKGSREVARKVEEMEGYSDGLLVREMLDQKEAMWPRRPPMIPAYADWLQRASVLLDRLPGHEQALRSLGAAPRSTSEGVGSPASLTDARLRWRVHTLSTLVSDLTELQQSVPEVGERREFASQIEARTVADHQEVWEEVLDDVFLDERFDGLELQPIPGLIPLEPDPDTGFWEFWHVESGARPERDPNSGQWLVTPETGVILVLLPGGPFWMGSQSHEVDGPNYDPEALKDRSAREEWNAPFLLSKYEMTQAQWFRLEGNRPSISGESDFGEEAPVHPVESILWEDCFRSLARWELTLPSEKQWEYAARGGTSEAYWTGADKRTLRDAENVADRRFRDGLGFASGFESEDWDDGFAAHAPVGSYRPNPFGFFDMLGNVMEHCLDLVASDGQPDPDGAHRVVRGGAFMNSARLSTASFRTHGLGTYANQDIGVRPAMNLPEIPSDR